MATKYNFMAKSRFANVYKFLEGGPMPPEAAGGAPAGGEDPMQMILLGAMQAVLANDGNLALQVCQALVQVALGGGAPAGGAPGPEEAPGGEAVMARRGGKISLIARR